MAEDKTFVQRMRKMRESRKAWLKRFAYGLSADGLVGSLVRGDAEIRWIRNPKEKGSRLRKQTTPKR